MKPQQIIDLVKAWGIEIKDFELDLNGKVISLKLRQKEIVDLSPLQSLRNLTVLYLPDNQISDLSPLQSLRNLTELYLPDNQISDLSPLQSLKNLSKIDLSFNRISDLSPLQNLRNLTIIGLNRNQISDLNPLQSLKDLTVLDLSNNQISDISPLQSLKDLNELDLISNQISDLSPLQSLKNLTKINLSDNQIFDLSPLQSLHDLTTLYLVDNQISDLIPLQSLHDLTDLSLRANQISDLSPLQSLKNLTILYLSNNQISDLSPLQSLKNLTILNLNSNQISDLSTLKNLKNVNTLDLRKNQIFNLSPLKGLIKGGLKAKYEFDLEIYSIKLDENPLTHPPIEIVKEGNEAILNWFEEYEKEIAKGEQPLNEAKMIVLGNVGAGKSSLVNFLVGKPFVETKSTEGFRIEQREIKDENGIYRINVWDFGGDEIQQTLHRFFLTQDTLYVVLVDSRYEENPNKYLEEIKSYAPNSPVLVVVNRIDEKYWGVDEAQLLSDYRTPSDEPMIKGFFKTSVLKAHRDQDPSFLSALIVLEEAIVAQLLAMPTLRQSVPSNYFKVKSALESRFFKETPYITHDSYQKLCREKNLELASDDALLGILDRLGAIRYLDKTHTRYLHILNPEWLSDGVYRILTSKHTHNLHGIISEEDFSKILCKNENHVFEYPKQHYGYLIEMIRQFYLGYMQPETEKIFIPQAFGTDYPAHFNPEMFKTNALHFFFKYETHIPSGAISSFIARKFGQVQGNYYWQKGIVIEKQEADETQVALVMQTDIKNRIDIWVQGKHRREFFIEIRQIFREFHEKYVALKVEEMVGLDARRETAVKYRVLIAQKHKGKIEYIDEEGNDYNIDALLGSFETFTTTQQAIYQTFQGNYYDMRGSKNIQFIRNEAQTISSELTDLVAQNQEMSVQNKALLEQLIDNLKELQKLENTPETKGIMVQLRETVKNMPKIASEEAVKWATKSTLDGVSFKDKFESIYQKLLEFGQGLNPDFLDNINIENYS